MVFSGIPLENLISYLVPFTSVRPPPDMEYSSIYEVGPAGDVVARAGDYGFMAHVFASKTMVYMLPSTSKFAAGSAGRTAFPFCEKSNIDVTLGLSLDEIPL